MHAPTLRRALTLVAALSLFAALAATLAPAAGAKQIKRCNGQRVLCDQPFNELVLAGAHNAMSSESLGWKLPNQSVAIPEQLNQRIRGFLIDTHYGRMNSDGMVITDDDGNVSPDVGPRDTYLCHEYCQLGATPLVDGLAEFSDFLDRHPNNVLLIDNEDYVTPEDFAKAARKSGLTKHVYKGSTDQWMTPREMIAAKQQVVVLADNNGGSIPWYHETYAGILQETPYTFNNPHLLWDAPNWKASCGPNRGDVTGSMFLMNHWSPSTPPATPDLETSAHVNARAVIKNRARKCAQVRGRLPSIIATDQSTVGGLVQAVRDLNALAIAHPALLGRQLRR